MLRRRRRKTSKEERVCSICSWCFRKAEHLERHMRTHTKEKPFQCQICSKAYTRQDTLLRHLRSHHAEQSSYEASIELQGGLLDLTPHTDTEVLEGEIDMARVQPLPAPAYTGDQTTGTSSTGCFVDDENPSNDFTWLPQWNGALDPQWDSWFIGEDFDFGALDLYPASPFRGLRQPVPGPQGTPPITSPDALASLEYSSGNELTIAQRWHTYSGTSTEDLSIDHFDSFDQVDELYHRDLANTLRRRASDGPLPSTTFLNLCIQAYFTNFHPVFPIIHAPNFRPQSNNGLLLLSVCSVGSLFLGSSYAISCGISMYERLHKAILNSWEIYCKPGAASIIALQASVIGQAFGLLMGRPKDLSQVELFHGSMVVLVRKLRLFEIEDIDINVAELEGVALESAWRKWINHEEKKRIALAVLIHDAETSSIFHHAPLKRVSVEHVPRTSSNEAFASRNPESWKQIMLKELQQYQATNQPAAGAGTELTTDTPSPPFPDVVSDLGLIVMLEMIGLLALESRRSSYSKGEIALDCQNLLITWFEKYRTTAIYEKLAPGLMMLWHSDFMLLSMDLDSLERACGRDGPTNAERARETAERWARTTEAKRCIIHAMLIQKNFELLSIGLEPPVYTSMCLYRCGIAWFCYTRFGGTSVKGTGDGLDFPELQAVNFDGIRMLEDSKPYHGGLMLEPVFRIIDLLQRITHHKIAENFANTLLALSGEGKPPF